MIDFLMPFIFGVFIGSFVTIFVLALVTANKENDK